MGRKVGLDIGLGSCSVEKSASVAWIAGARAGVGWVDEWTCAREVAQVEAGSRDLGHVAVGGGGCARGIEVEPVER